MSFRFVRKQPVFLSENDFGIDDFISKRSGGGGGGGGAGSKGGSGSKKGSGRGLVMSSMARFSRRYGGGKKSAGGIPMGVGLLQIDAASMFADGIAAEGATIPYMRDHGAHGLADSTTQATSGSRMIMRAGGPTGYYIESRKSRLNVYSWPGISAMPVTAQPYYFSFLLRHAATVSGQNNLIEIGAFPVYQYGSYFTAGQKARLYAGSDTPATPAGTWPASTDWSIPSFKVSGTGSWFRLNRGSHQVFFGNGTNPGGNPGTTSIPFGGAYVFGKNNSSCPDIDYAHVFVTSSLAELEAFEDAAATLAGIVLP